MLNQTKINPELREKGERMSPSPGSQSGQSLLAHGSPLEVKASVRSSSSEQQSRPVLSVSSSAQQSRLVPSVSSSEQQSRPVPSVSSSEQQSRPVLSVSSSAQQSRPVPSVSSEQQSRPVLSVSSSEQQSRQVPSVSSSAQQSRPVLSVSSSEQQSRQVPSVSSSAQQSRQVHSNSQSELQPPKPEEQAPPSLPSPVVRSTYWKNEFSVTTNWCFATISLLLICAVLLSMVIIMGSQVAKLSNTSEEQSHLMHFHIRILTETLRQLQTGQDHTCSVCKIKWVQRAEHCFLFSGKKMSWHWSNSFCKDESSTLAIVDTQEEMDFLMRESKKYFDLVYGQYQYHKFWIGLIYDPGVKKWIWANETPSDLNLQALDQKGCIYLQNGKLHSQDCGEMTCFICKTNVQFGWS